MIIRRPLPSSAVPKSGSGRSPGKGRSPAKDSFVINTSPTAGTITALSTASGSYINDPTQPLMTTPISITSSSPPAYQRCNRPSFTRTKRWIPLTAYPGRTFHGHVTSISGLLDPDTRRNKVQYFLGTGYAARADMFAMVSILPPPVETLTISTSALLMNNDNTTVFIETKPWTFARRVVDLGSDAEGMVAIRSGLSAGDRIVVREGCC